MYKYTDHFLKEVVIFIGFTCKRQRSKTMVKWLKKINYGDACFWK